MEGLGGLQGLKPRFFCGFYVAAKAATYEASAKATEPAGGQRYKNVLIYGSAIRNRSKSFSYSKLKFSNRR